jgi:hypothetical protein
MSEKTEYLYVSETHTLYLDNEELHICGEDFEIVWNCETLFTDLPFITNLVFKARAETDKRIKEDLEQMTRLIP